MGEFKPQQAVKLELLSSRGKSAFIPLRMCLIDEEQSFKDFLRKSDLIASVLSLLTDCTVGANV